MTKKRQAQSETAMPFGFSLPTGLDGTAFFAIQQRNMEACMRAANLVSEAMTTIAAKQADMLKGMADLSPAMPSPGTSATPENVEALVHKQSLSGRQSIEKTVRAAREMNDIARVCCYDLADEVEAWSRDVWHTLDENAPIHLSSEAPQAPSGTAQASSAAAKRPRAVGE